MSTSLRATLLVGTTLILLTACGQATTTTPDLPTVTPLAPMTMQPVITMSPFPVSTNMPIASSVIPTVAMLPTSTSTSSSSGKVAMTTYNQAGAAFSFDYPRGWSVNQDELYSVSLDSPQTLAARANYADGVKNQTTPMDTPAISTDAVITYYPTIADEYANKTDKLGAKTLTELLQKDKYIEVIGDTIVDALPAKEVFLSGMPPSYMVYVAKGAGLYVARFPKSRSESDLTPEQRSILLSLKLLK